MSGHALLKVAPLSSLILYARGRSLALLEASRAFAARRSKFFCKAGNVKNSILRHDFGKLLFIHISAERGENPASSGEKTLSLQKGAFVLGAAAAYLH